MYHQTKVHVNNYTDSCRKKLTKSSLSHEDTTTAVAERTFGKVLLEFTRTSLYVHRIYGEYIIIVYRENNEGTGLSVYVRLVTSKRGYITHRELLFGISHRKPFVATTTTTQSANLHNTRLLKFLTTPIPYYSSRKTRYFFSSLHLCFGLHIPMRWGVKLAQ